MPPRKSPRTKVRTGVTTGTAVAMLFLTASAAFAAAAFTKMPVKIPLLMKGAAGPDLTFFAGKPGVANFSDATTLQLQAVYTNAGSVEAGNHQTTYYFMDKNKIGLRLPQERMSWGVLPIPAGGIKEVDLRVPNVPADAVYIALQLDTVNNVIELSETNNLMTIPLNRPSAPAQRGRISMSLGGDTPISRIIVGGTNDVPMLKVKFTATSEAFTVKKLRIFNDTPADDTGISQIKLTYPTASGAMETKTGVLSSAVAEFQGLNMFVPANGDATLAVSVDLMAINVSGISGDTPQLGVDWDSNFEAVGQSSGATFTFAGSPEFSPGQDVQGYEMIVYKTKPTFSITPSSPVGARVLGYYDVLQFIISADAAGPLEWTMLTFKVNATDVANTDWNTGNNLLKTKFTLVEGGQVLPCVWDLRGTDGYAYVAGTTGDVMYASCGLLNNPARIAAGTTKTFNLKIDTTGASIGDTVQVTIPDTNVHIAAAPFAWNETGVGAVSPWVPATYVRNLPIVGNVIRY